MSKQFRELEYHEQREQRIWKEAEQSEEYHNYVKTEAENLISDAESDKNEGKVVVVSYDVLEQIQTITGVKITTGINHYIEFNLTIFKTKSI